MATPATRTNNKLRVEDRAVHDWYRFVLSYPPHLVREYLDRFGISTRHCVLDPFCGTGTSLVECKKLGIRSIGIEANPMACFASRVKLDWSLDPKRLLRHAETVAQLASKRLRADGLEETRRLPLFRGTKNPTSELHTLPPALHKLLLKDSISPVPLHKTLVLLQTLAEQSGPRFEGHERLALAKALVYEIGNLHFGPEVGIGPPKSDAPVVSAWLDQVRSISEDLCHLKQKAHVSAIVHLGDSRQIQQLLPRDSVDAVITSPPYPNEKDYTRTTRLESVLLGFIRNKQDLRALKETLIRSNTRGVFKADGDDQFIGGNKEIQGISSAIESRRVELGKTSGFEKLYARVVKLYFGGIARHLSELQVCLRPGAQLAYVVGDQASYLRVMIRTGKIIADIARSLGYEVVGIDLFRTRWATASREQLREEVVLLRWSGRSQ